MLLPSLGTALLLGAVLLAALKMRDVLSIRLVDTPPPLFATEPREEADVSRASAPSRPQTYYSEITERPIFSPTRRPVEAESPPEIVEEEVVVVIEPIETVQRLEPPNLRILGTMSAGNRNTALLEIEGVEADWIAVGASVNGWTLSEIGSDWIELEADGQVLRMEMYN